MPPLLRGARRPSSSFRGARLRASPESITTIGGYGFRVCAQEGASRNDGVLRKLRRRHHLGAGGLVHGGVGGVGDPGLLVDERNAPAAVAVAGQKIEPRDRAVIDGERQSL